MRISLLRCLVGALIVFAVAAARPAAATPVDDTDAAVAASLTEPAAGTGGALPVEFFLQNGTPGPAFLETMIERLRGLRDVIARALHSVGEDEADPGVETARQTPEPGLDVAEELGAGEEVGAADRARELADRIRNAEATRDEAAGRAALAAHDIGLRDSPMLGADITPGAGSGLRSGPAPLEPPKLDERGPWRLLAIALEVLTWMRDQPLLTLLGVSLVGFVLWMRAAAHRTE